MAELSEVFWVAFIGTISAMFGLSLRMCLRSRCKDVECFCFKVKRDVDLESQEVTHQQEMTSTSEKINH